MSFTHTHILGCLCEDTYLLFGRVVLISVLVDHVDRQSTLSFTIDEYGCLMPLSTIFHFNEYEFVF